MAYFILAYGISWAVQIPLALKAQGLSQAPISFSIHYLAGYGPMFSAVIVTWLTDGVDGLRELWRRMLKWRVQPLWWLVAISPLVLYGMVSLHLAQRQDMPWTMLGQVDFLPNMGFGTFFLWLLTYGMGEEMGWRGFALPRLQKNRSALLATFILWVFWALWHLPAFFYLYDSAIAIGFLLGILVGAVVFSWLYNSTEGSILMVSLFHGTFNFTTGCTAWKAGMTSAIVSTLIMVWAVIVTLLFKPMNLSHMERHVV
ncbi:MAG: CPBP family glutamic-type intramembrane protease, partial [Pseudanabaenaceae cyanobacterium]